MKGSYYNLYIKCETHFLKHCSLGSESDVNMVRSSVDWLNGIRKENEMWHGDLANLFQCCLCVCVSVCQGFAGFKLNCQKVQHATDPEFQMVKHRSQLRNSRRVKHKKFKTYPTQAQYSQKQGREVIQAFTDEARNLSPDFRLDSEFLTRL